MLTRNVFYTDLEGVFQTMKSLQLRGCSKKMQANIASIKEAIDKNSTPPENPKQTEVGSISAPDGTVGSIFKRHKQS